MGDKDTATKREKGSMRTIFMHADAVDVLLMVVGVVGSVGDGLTLPVALVVLSKLTNLAGETISKFDEPHSLTRNIDRNSVYLCYVGVGAWCLCFLEGYCWTRTAERQAARMRVRYLKAVLRQDVGYFDLHVTGTSEVITSVSSDSLIIQDCISEKLQDLAGGLSQLVGEVAESRLEMRLLRIAREDSQRLQAELTEATAKNASLEESLRLQQAQYGLLRARNLQLEEALRTSVRAVDIAPLLETKYWDGIHLCRRLMRLLYPRFPTPVLDPRNASATCPRDVYGLAGRPFPGSPRSSPPGGPRPGSQPESSSRAEASTSRSEGHPETAPPQGPTGT